MFSILFFSVALFAQSPQLPSVRPVRISRSVLVDRKINMQTQMVLDEAGTAYLMSVFASGQVTSMRISNKGAAKDAVMYLGWPYILDRRGRLIAMDISWQTIMRSKTPAVLQRIRSNLGNAAALGLGLAGVGLIDSVWGFGINNLTYNESAFLGASGFLTYFATDSLVTYLFRSPKTLGTGGNFFRRVVARKVDRVEATPSDQDYSIIYRNTGDPSRPRLLSDVAPEYTTSPRCQFFLSRLINE